MGTAKQAWTGRHVNEANAALYRLAADALGKDEIACATDIIERAQETLSTATEHDFVCTVIDLFGADENGTFAQASARRVRARAEGREVVEVETFYRVRLANGLYWPANGDDDSSDAVAADAWRSAERRHADGFVDGIPGARVVRVTLTRRRIVRAKKGS